MTTGYPLLTSCFRPPAEKHRDARFDSFAEDETKDQASEKEEYLRCRQCNNVITSPSERIQIQGSHQHTFANPHGIVFEIGCFKSVKGCGHIGPSSDEFSWFKGFRWRVAVCIVCLMHLGWLFVAPDGTSFHGLILDRLKP